MTTFSMPGTFHLVIAPYFALNHLPSQEAVLATFMRAAEHLEPDGCFAMHVHDIDRALATAGRRLRRSLFDTTVRETSFGLIC